MSFSYQPYAISMRKKIIAIFLKKDNNTNDYNNLYAHFTWITDKTRANPFCYYHVLRLILNFKGL